MNRLTENFEFKDIKRPNNQNTEIRLPFKRNFERNLKRIKNEQNKKYHQRKEQKKRKTQEGVQNYYVQGRNQTEVVLFRFTSKQAKEVLMDKRQF